MDEKSNKIIADLQQLLESKGIQPIQAVKPVVSCQACKDKGYVLVTEDGYTTAIPCKDCHSKRITEKRLQYAIGRIGRYKEYTLDTFLENTPTHAMLRKKAVEYVNGYDGTQSFGVFGRSGTGKTHLCIAICQELLNRYNKPFYYFEYRQEMPKLKTQMASFSDNAAFNDEMRKLKEVENLYIDDAFKLFETGERMDSKELQIMFELINGRYVKNKATLFSSEYSVKEIMKIDEALGSRIFEMCVPFGLKAEGANERIKL